MAQTLFTAASELSLPLVDANFTELYNAVQPGSFLGAGATLTYIAAGVIGFRTTNDAVGGGAHSFAVAYQGGGVRYGMGFVPGANNTFPITFANAANITVGNIYTTATSTAFNTTSDRRLKCEIRPADSPGAIIDAIQVVSHAWASDPSIRVSYGVIAQDLASVLPEAVTPGDDSDEVVRAWSVDASKAVWLLLAELQALRRRVAALEAAAA